MVVVEVFDFATYGKNFDMTRWFVEPDSGFDEYVLLLVDFPPDCVANL